MKRGTWDRYHGIRAGRRVMAIILSWYHQEMARLGVPNAAGKAETMRRNLERCERQGR